MKSRLRSRWYRANEKPLEKSSTNSQNQEPFGEIISTDEKLVDEKTVDPQRPEIPITESLNAMEIIGTTRPKILPIKGKIKIRKIVANEIHLPKKINPEGENRINLKIEQTRSEKKQILIRKKIRHRRSQFWEAFYPRFLVAKLST